MIAVDVSFARLLVCDKISADRVINISGTGKDSTCVKSKAAVVGSGMTI